MNEHPSDQQHALLKQENANMSPVGVDDFFSCMNDPFGTAKDLLDSDLDMNMLDLDAIDVNMDELQQIPNYFELPPPSPPPPLLPPMRKISDDEANAKDTITAQTRIRTYTARKREIEELLKELPQLESYVDYLKHKAADANDQTSSTQKKRIVNTCLRERVLQQQFLLARMQSAMTHHMATQRRGIPFDMFTHLSNDEQQRAATLKGLRPRILRDAKRFIMERSAYVDLKVACKEQTSYVTPEGDYCAMWFAVTPLEGVSSVKVVFDTLLSFLGNIDRVLTEQMGDLTLREGDAYERTEEELRGASQHRHLRVMSNGVEVESNTLLFSMFDPQDTEYGDGREYAMLATVPVDKDERFPYSPTGRLRQDLMSVMTVKTVKRVIVNEKKREEERVDVVLTRASFIKLHRGEMNIPNDVMISMGDCFGQSGEIVINMVKNAAMQEATTRIVL